MLASCASQEKKISSDTKYEIGKAPMLGHKSIVQFIGATVSASELNHVEKQSLLRELEVHFNEISALQAHSRKVFIAILSNLDNEGTSSEKVYKELETTAIKLGAKQQEKRIEIIKTIHIRLKGKISKEKQLNMIRRVFSPQTNPNKNYMDARI